MGERERGRKEGKEREEGKCLPIYRRGVWHTPCIPTGSPLASGKAHAFPCRGDALRRPPDGLPSPLRRATQRVAPTNASDGVGTQCAAPSGCDDGANPITPPCLSPIALRAHGLKAVPPRLRRDGRYTKTASLSHYGHAANCPRFKGDRLPTVSATARWEEGGGSFAPRRRCHVGSTTPSPSCPGGGREPCPITQTLPLPLRRHRLLLMLLHGHGRHIGGEPDAERAARAGLALDLEGAAVALDHLADEDQPQPRAALPGRARA